MRKKAKRCPHCRGSKKQILQDGAKKASCPVCKGVGRIKLDTFELKVIELLEEVVELLKTGGLP